MEQARSEGPPDLTELWRQFFDVTRGPRSDGPRNDQGFLDPFGLYRQWLDELGGRRPEGEGAGPPPFWRQLTDAATESWHRSAEVGGVFVRLAPRWAELAEELSKQMLRGGLPADPLDFFGRWYAGTSGPLTGMIRDLLSDDAYLEFTRRLFENYATLDAVARRFFEEFFARLQLSTSADSSRIAALVVGLDEKVDRLEETFEDSQFGGEGTAGAGEGAQLWKRLDRVEDKLDQLLGALGARADGTLRAAPADQRGNSGTRRRGREEGPR